MPDTAKANLREIDHAARDRKATIHVDVDKIDETRSQTAVEHLSLPYDPATRRLFGVP